MTRDLDQEVEAKFQVAVEAGGDDVKFERGGKKYVINIRTMMQRNVTTGSARAVRRLSPRKTVYLLRHGQSESNAAMFGSRIRDPALTDLGWKQACAWAPEAPNWGVELVLVSPLRRTVQTACMAFSETSVPLEITRSAREHGWNEAQNRGSPELLEVALTDLGPAASCLTGLGKLKKPHKFWDPCGEAGLPRAVLRCRRREASLNLLHKIQEAPAQSIACVCHYNVALQISGLRLSNAEVARCTFERDASLRWTLIDVEKLQLPPGPTEANAHGVVRTASHRFAAALECLAPNQSPYLPEVDSEEGTVGDADKVVMADHSTFSGSSSEDDSEGDEAGRPMPGIQRFGSPKRALDGGSCDEHVKPRTASVLIVGCSGRHGGVPAVLLGGGPGRNCYRFCDFGGGLDGGPRRFGGRSHAAEERKNPALGAFRELAEEFLGLHGDQARSVASAMWQNAEPSLVGLRPVLHRRRHLIFLCPAETLLPVLEDPRHASKGAKGANDRAASSAIDRLASLFKENKEVSSAALVSVQELLAGAERHSVAPLTPVWGWYGKRWGAPRFYDATTSTSLERLRDLPAAELVVSGKHGSRYSVIPSKLQQWDSEYKGSRTVFRWERIQLRSALVGQNGSIAAVAQTLRRWSDDQADQH